MTIGYFEKIKDAIPPLQRKITDVHRGLGNRNDFIVYNRVHNGEKTKAMCRSNAIQIPDGKSLNVSHQRDFGGVTELEVASTLIDSRSPVHVTLLICFHPRFEFNLCPFR